MDEPEGSLSSDAEKVDEASPIYIEDRLERTQNILRQCLKLLSLSPSNSCVYGFPSTDGSERGVLSRSELSVSSCEADYDAIRIEDIEIVRYEYEHLSYIMDLMSRNLSEVYHIYIYRTFVDLYPDFTYVARDSVNNQLVGAIVGKKDLETNSSYIGMLAVEEYYRMKGIGKALIKKFVEISQVYDCSYVALETEVINKGALRLYSTLGFIREKVLPNYYVNGNDAFQLKLYLTSPCDDNCGKPKSANVDQIETNKRFQQLYV